VNIAALTLSTFNRPVLRPLRQRDFAIVWSAAAVSNIGTWVQTVAVGILVTQLTGRAAWTGLAAAAAFLPLGLLSPVGGAMADRRNRRHILLVTTTGEAITAAALAVLVGTGSATPALVVGCVLVGACLTAFGLPAYQAILPELVDREDLLGASALSLAQYNLGRVVGPAVAAVVLARGSFTWAFTLNAVSYGAVLAGLLLVRLPRNGPPSGDGSLVRRIGAGIRAVRAEPGCRLAIATVALSAFLVAPFMALIPAVAVKLFASGEAGTSLLITAQGVGAVTGGLALAGLARRVGRRRVLVTDLLVLPVLVVIYALAPTLPVAAVMVTLVGAAYVGILSGLGTVVQLRAPTALRARVMSLYMVALGSLYPLGALAQGVLGDRFGLRTVTVGGAVLFALTIVAVGLLRPGVSVAFDDPSPAAAATFTPGAGGAGSTG